MPGTPPQREYFVDRSLGRYAVADALRSAGHNVHTMAEVYGAREQNVADHEWLARAGREGWVVPSKDRRLRWRPAEIQAIADHVVRAFVLARGGLTGEHQAKQFLTNMRRIERALDDPGPFVYAVYQRRIERLWPRRRRKGRR